MQKSCTKGIQDEARHGGKRELCKGIKFCNAEKRYMYESESIFENEMCKILWYFEIK